jgi:Mor family transcriptional regulator
MGKLTDTEKITLIDDYRNGIGLNELSLKYKIHRTSVRNLLKRRGEN